MASRDDATGSCHNQTIADWVIHICRRSNLEENWRKRVGLLLSLPENSLGHFTCQGFFQGKQKALVLNLNCYPSMHWLTLRRLRS